jgi:HSP20 family protein
MTTTHTPETSSGNTQPARHCGPRGCGPRGGGPHFGGSGYIGSGFGGPGAGRRQAPVNIEETPEAYLLSLYAAGLDKSGLHVSVQGDVLTLRYLAPAADDSMRNFTRRELPHTHFEREFALNARVQLDAITASYSEGVLSVRLPKTPDAMRPEQQVPVQ